MSITLKDLCFDAGKSIGEELLLVEKPKAYFKFFEGVRQEQEGWEYRCISERLNYEKVSVKVAGMATSQVEYDGKPIRVRFEGIEGKVWQDYSNRGEIRLSITAKEIVPIVENKRMKINVGERM